jgi:DNA-directed RNA polymerase subunit RPC12/RpoP
MIYCEPCGYKRIIESDVPPEDLVQIKTSQIQSHIPQFDPVTQKAILKPNITQQTKVKCPNCGRGVRIRELLPVYTKLFEEINEEKERQRREEDKKRRIEDGKPLKKKIDPDFLG